MEDRKGRLFLRLCLSGFLAFLSYSLSRFPVIPLYAESLGVGAKAIGLIVAASTITGIFGKFLSGGLSDIYGRRRLLIAGLLVFAFAPYLYLFVNGYISLLVIRFIHGSATAIFGPVVSAIISDIVEKERRGERLATYSSAAMVGNTIGPWLGGILISAGGFTYPFLASGIAGVAALISIFRWPETIHKTTPGDPSIVKGRFMDGLREVVSNLSILGASITQALQFFATGAIEGFLPIYAKQVAGLKPWQIGFLFGVQTVSTLMARPIMGAMSDRVGRRPQIIAGLLCGASIIWMIPHIKIFYGLITLVVIYGLAVAVVISATPPLITDLCKRHNYGSAHGLFGTITDMGHAGGPIVAGILVAGLGYHMAFGFFSIGLLFAGIFFFLAVKEVNNR